MTQPDALALAKSIETYLEGKLSKLAAAELRRLHDYESAYEIWSEKTNWVQDSSQAHELGKHRADVLKDRIDRLHEVNQELLEALEVLSGEANRFNVSGVYFNE
jgi:hypothetical protein